MASNPPPGTIGLTPEQIKELDDGEHEIKRLHAELDRAVEAGLNVDDIRATLNDADELRKGMLRVYGKAPIRRRG